jgi:hypothetical protein
VNIVGVCTSANDGSATANTTGDRQTLPGAAVAGQYIVVLTDRATGSDTMTTTGWTLLATSPQTQSTTGPRIRRLPRARQR